MFAKPNSSVQFKGNKKAKEVVLRKSDCRQLRQRVATVVVGDHQADVLEAVFSPGHVVARSITVANERVVLYVRQPSNSSDDTSLWPYQAKPQVVWIEIDHGPHRDKSQIPTVALLSVLSTSTWWNNDDDNNNNTVRTLPLVAIPAPVSKYLCRGAHLMKAGMREVLAATHNVADGTTTPTTYHPTTGTIVGICVEGNPQPLAVGWIAAGIQTPADWGPGRQGEGVHIVTCYGDDLWQQQQPQTTSSSQSTSSLVSPLNAPYDAGHYGNPAFHQGQFVLPLEGSGEEVNDENDNKDDAPDTEKSAKAGQGVPSLHAEAVTTPQSQDESESANATTTTTTTTNNNNVDDDSQPTPEEILHEAVCRALVRLQPQTDLPMPVSVFYAQHVLPNRRDGSTIQLKQTRYKKFGAYLQEQMERGLLTVGPDAAKKDPLALLTAYERRHADLQPYRADAQTEKTAERIASQTRLVLLDLCVIPNHFVKLLRLDPDIVKAVQASSEERRNSGYLTTKEARAILDDYISREQCLDPHHPGRVLLDGPLTDALYKKSNTPPPASLTRKELAVAWQAKLEAAYALVQMPGSRIVQMGRGHGPRARIEVSARQNKKYVTKIRGMEGFGLDATEFQREIAHRLACAVSVDENPHEKLPKGHVELILQGNWVDELEAIWTGDTSLTNHGGAKESPYALPKNAVEVVLRKGVPARKGRPGKKK